MLNGLHQLLFCTACEKLQLYCGCCLGVPTPEVKWFKNNAELNRDTEQRMVFEYDPETSNCFLEIRDVTEKDTDIYKVTAQNEQGVVSRSTFVCVQKAKEPSPELIGPKFAVVPETISSRLGETAKFICKLDQGVTAEVTWSKDGFDILPKETDRRVIVQFDSLTEEYTLTVNEVVDFDLGQYKVTAMDVKGLRTEHDFWLNQDLTEPPAVETPEPEAPAGILVPIFSKVPQSLTLMQEEPAAFTCQLEQSADNEVCWFKDDCQIKPKKRDKRVLINWDISTDEMSLVIKKVTLDDAGHYRVDAIHATGGKASAPFDLCVLENESGLPPDKVFSMKPESVDAGLNELVTFKCKLIDNKSTEIEWYKDGDKVLPKEDKHVVIDWDINTEEYSLIINQVKHADVGKYRVDAVKGSRSISSVTFELTMNIKQTITKDAPERPGVEFVEKPETQVVHIDETVVFRCKLAETADIDCLWYKDDNLLVDTKDSRVRIDADISHGEFSLTISHCAEDDAGDYRLDAMRETAVIDSVAFGLTVSVNESSRSRSATPTGSSRSIEAPRAPPVFKLAPEDTSAALGDKVTFVAQLEDPVDIDVTWYKAGELIKPKKRDKRHRVDWDLETDEFILELKDVREDDYCEYRVEALNAATGDKAETAFVLSSPVEKPPTIAVKEPTPEAAPPSQAVPEPPEFLLTPASQSVETGETIKATCKLVNNEDVDVTWFKDDDLLKSQGHVEVAFDETTDEYVLIIANATFADAGKYKVEARHPTSGVMSAQFDVSVAPSDEPLAETIPEFAEAPTPVTVRTGETIEVRCRLIEAADTEMNWYKDDAQLGGSDSVLMETENGEFVMKIADAKPEDAGQYKAEAVHVTGGVTAVRFGVDVIQVTEPVWKVAPQAIETPILEGVKVEAQLENADDIEVTWHKNGNAVRSKVGGRVQVESDGCDHRLLIEQAYVTDKGLYSVTAHHSSGGESTVEFYLSVTEPLLQERDLDVVWSEVDGDAIEPLPATGEADQNVADGFETHKPLPVMKDCFKSEKKVKLGDDVTIQFMLCNSEGAEVAWLKNNDVIKPKKKDKRLKCDWDMDSDAYMLKIFDATTKDSAVYTALVTAEDVAISATICLEILEPKPVEVKEPEVIEQPALPEPRTPVFELKPSAIEAVVGATIAVTCRLQESAEMTVAWNKDGIVFDSSRDTRYSVTQETHDFTLKIDDVRESDSGHYGVTATHVAGPSTTEEFDITVVLPVKEEPKPVEFTLQPESVTLPLGDSHTFQCKLANGEGIDVTWRKNGNVLKPRKRDKHIKLDWDMDTDIYSLSINDVIEDDVATYSVEAGEVKVEFELKMKVVVTPSFSLTPESANVLEHESVTFTCKLENRSETEVTWKHRETLLTETVNTHIESDATTEEFKLNICDVTVDNSGEYSIIARHETGGETSFTFSLKVQKLPLEFSETPESQSVNLSDTVTFTCKLKDSADVEVTWMKENVEIKPKRKDKHIKTDWLMDKDQYVFTIMDVKESDFGNYTVKAKRNSLDEKIAAFTLEEIPPKEQTPPAKKEEQQPSEETPKERTPSPVLPPVFAAMPVSTSVLLGSRAIFSCKLEIAFDVEVTWLKNGDVIKPKKRQKRVVVDWNIDSDEFTLTINDVTVDDFGPYSVKAVNKSGLEAIVDFNLDQKTPFVIPEFEVKPQDIVVDIGATIVLPCRAKGTNLLLM